MTLVALRKKLWELFDKGQELHYTYDKIENWFRSSPLLAPPRTSKPSTFASHDCFFEHDHLAPQPVQRSCLLRIWRLRTPPHLCRPCTGRHLGKPLDQVHPSGRRLPSPRRYRSTCYQSPVPREVYSEWKWIQLPDSVHYRPRDRTHLSQQIPHQQRG